MLRDQGIRVCAKRIMRLMARHGITPRLKRRKRHDSYSGEHTPAPANLVNRRFHAKAPNRLWVTDITEFRHIGQNVLIMLLVCRCGSRRVGVLFSVFP